MVPQLAQFNCLHFDGFRRSSSILVVNLLTCSHKMGLLNAQAVPGRVEGQFG